MLSNLDGTRILLLLLIGQSGYPRNLTNAIANFADCRSCCRRTVPRWPARGGPPDTVPERHVRKRGSNIVSVPSDLLGSASSRPTPALPR